MRLAVRPGLTGWAQANGLRGQTRDAGLAKARIDHDVAYIQNFSLWLDAAILLMTLRREFITGSGE
jgi:lipopolysaccharide/colanic/teichoic acid biosynthesis glycosyltransferase